MSFAELINQKSFTQENLAEKSKVSLSTIKRAINGGNVNGTTSKRLAKALDISAEELNTIMQQPTSYIEKLVAELIADLNTAGLQFKPKKDSPDEAIYISIRESLGISGKLSYFLREFERLAKQAESKGQLAMLQNLLLYCSAYMVEHQSGIDITACKQLTLRGEGGAWALRIFINANLQELEDVNFETYQSPETGALALASVEGAERVGEYVDGADDREVFRNVAESLTSKEPLTSLKCPAQFRENNGSDQQKLKDYCQQLNKRIEIRRDNYNNMFAFASVPITTGLAKLFNQYLPALRLMSLQLDSETTFLIPAKTDIETLLIECLEMLTKQKSIISGETPTNNEVESVTAISITGSNNITMFGNHNSLEININAKIEELIPVLEQLREGLLHNLSPESDEIVSLDQAIQQDSIPPKSRLQVINNALNKVGQGINQGTKLSTLYTQAKTALTAIMVAV